MAIPERRRLAARSGWFAVAAGLLISSVMAVSPVAAQTERGTVGGLKAVSGAPGELTVTWDAALPVPDDYRVAWAPVGENYRTWADLTGNAFPTKERVMLSGLREGVEYKLLVRARYRQGGAGDGPWSGPWSNEATATVAVTPTVTRAVTRAGVVGSGRGAIGGVEMVSDAPGELTVTWSRSRPAPTDYQVQWALEGEGFDDAISEYPTAEVLRLSGLAEGETYKVRMRSRQSWDTSHQWLGPWSFTYKAVTAVTTEPVIAEQATEAAIEREPSAALLEGEMTVGAGQHFVRKKPVSAPAFGYAYRGGGMGSFEVDAVAENATWRIGGMRLLMWLPSTFDVGAFSEVTDTLTFGYSDELRLPFALSVGAQRFESADAVNPAGNLALIGRYWVWDRSGVEWTAGETLAVTVMEAVRQPPAGLAMLDAGTTALTVNWGEPDGAPVTGYDVQYRAVDATVWVDGPQAVDGMSALIEGLQPDSVYEARVRSTDVGGAGEWSEPKSARTAFWEATLTVRSLGGSPSTWGYWGYQNRYSSFGGLEPNSVTYDGTEYEFFILSWFRGSRRGGYGDPQPSHTEALDFYAREHVIPDNWVLRLGHKRFPVADASWGGYLIGADSPEYKLYWTDPGLSLSLGAQYPVSLSHPVS